jgi:HSP20 family protein
MFLFKANSALNDQMPLLFDDFFGRDLFNKQLAHFSPTNTTIPAVNIKETNDSYEVELAAPGMKKEDFMIRLDGQNLVISSEKSAEFETGEKGQYTNREFSYQSFSRTFKLANEILDTEKIQAKYENGVLQLSVPKKESAKQKEPKLIQIS